MHDDAMLSRILFEARERVEMSADITEKQTGKPDDWGRRLVKEIDDYRAEQGWSPNGWGGEDGRLVFGCSRPAPHGFHTYLIGRVEYACKGHD